MKAQSTLISFVIVLCGTLSVSASDNWPQFRGPNSSHVVEETMLPSEWSADNNLQWKFKVPGRGWSSPIVWGDRIFITTTVPDKMPELSEDDNRRGPAFVPKPMDATYRWEVHCLDLKSGRSLWSQVATSGHPGIKTHNGNTYASETPVTDGERVYAYFGMMGVYCYDFDGKLIWKKDFGAFPMQGDWGSGSSPVLFEDLLYLQIDSEEAAFLVALDARSGEERWRIKRDEGSNWGSPMIWRNKVRTELVAPGQKARAYDPDTGKLLWELDMGGGRNCSTPSGNDELLYLGNEERQGSGGFLFAVKAGASGDISLKEGESGNDWVAWSVSNSGLAMSSPLVYKGQVYVLERRRGVLNCYDARTGEAVYKTRLDGARAFWASPWANDGKVFCPDDTGTTHVVEAGSEFKVLTTNTLHDTFWASSAIAGESIILRGVNHVYCIQQAKEDL